MFLDRLTLYFFLIVLNERLLMTDTIVILELFLGNAMALPCVTKQSEVPTTTHRAFVFPFYELVVFIMVAFVSCFLGMTR